MFAAGAGAVTRGIAKHAATKVGQQAVSTLRASMSTSSRKVAVLGAAGGIGQPLSMLLKLSPQVGELACYDIVGTPGVAADLSHISTPSYITGHLPAAGCWPPRGNTGIAEALTGCDVVVIPAGVPRKPGMTRDDLFNVSVFWLIGRHEPVFVNDIGFAWHC
jgi:malate dehydrogenase